MEVQTRRSNIRIRGVPEEENRGNRSEEIAYEKLKKFCRISFSKLKGPSAQCDG